MSPTTAPSLDGLGDGGVGGGALVPPQIASDSEEQCLDVRVLSGPLDVGVARVPVDGWVVKATVDLTEREEGGESRKALVVAVAMEPRWCGGKGWTQDPRRMGEVWQ